MAYIYIQIGLAVMNKILRKTLLSFWDIFLQKAVKTRKMQFSSYKHFYMLNTLYGLLNHTESIFWNN